MKFINGFSLFDSIKNSFKATMRSLSAIMISLILSQSRAVYGDYIEIEDGSTINGNIFKILDRTIFVKTSFAGEIKIDQDRVIGLKIEKEMYFYTSDGLYFLGKIFPDKDPGFVRRKNGEQAIDLQRIIIASTESIPPKKH